MVLERLLKDLNSVKHLLPIPHVDATDCTPEGPGVGESRSDISFRMLLLLRRHLKSLLRVDLVLFPECHQC